MPPPLAMAFPPSGRYRRRPMKLVLYDYYRSSASYRVRIALALKGLAYERVPVNLLDGGQRGADYLARNPQGFVPMLEADGERLTQSLAIIDWLDARVPEPKLLPDEGRAHVLALALTIAADIHPLNNLRVLKRLSALGVEQDARDDWYRHWVREGFEALEALAAPRAGRFLFGDAPTLADICLVPQMYNARRFEVDLTAYPILVRADAEAAALDAFAAAHPDRVAPDRGTG
jgi:maleylacetoacetate isomerase